MEIVIIGLKLYKVEAFSVGVGVWLNQVEIRLT
jgi:hypothetical protein